MSFTSAGLFLNPHAREFSWARAGSNVFRAIARHSRKMTQLSAFAVATFGSQMHASSQSAQVAGLVTTFGTSVANAQGTAVDASGNVYIANIDGAIYKESYNAATGTYTQTTILTTSSESSAGIAVDLTGTNLYVSTGTGKTVQWFTGSGTTYTLQQTFSSLAGVPLVTVDKSLNIYIADETIGIISKETYSAGHYTQTNIATGFSSPESLTVDLNGNVFVSDSGTNRLTKLTPPATGTTYVATLLTISGLSSLHGIAVDAADNLYIQSAATVIEATLSGGVYTTSEFYPYNGQSLALDSAANLYLGSTYQSSETKLTIAPSFGSVPVGTPAPQIPVTFTFDVPVALGTSSAVTQGSTGLDFSLGTGSTCAAGPMEAAGDTCVVNVVFTPRASGQRLGAVNLFSSTGTLIATALVSGTGTGPQLLFLPDPNLGETASFHLTNPRGLSLDSAGNMYMSSGGSILKLSLQSGNTTTVSTVCANTTSTTVDGAGNVFFGCNSNSTLYELLGGQGTALVIATGVHFDCNLAVDGTGNLFASDSSTGAIVEVLARSHAVTTLIVGGAGRRFVGMTLDAKGSLFAVDYNNNILYELVAGGSSLTVLASGSPMNHPYAITVDGAGNLYVSNPSTEYIYRYSVSNYGAPATQLQAPGETGLVIDVYGTIYTSFSGYVIESPRTAMSPILFANTAVGATSSAQTVTLENDGNANLIFSPSANGNNPSLSAGFTVASSSTCPQLSMSSSPVILASGASCTDVISFAPTQAGSVSGTMITTDDSLNILGTSQRFTLSGTATVGTPSVTVANASAAVGSIVTFTAVVSGSGVAPSGAVTFNVATGRAIQALCAEGTSTETCTVSYPTTGLAAGPNSISAGYAADSNYAAANGAGTLTLTAGTPTISWSSPPPYVYPTPLSSTQLNATASVPGNFIYAPPVGTVLGAGVGQTLSVTFTPTDTVNYSAATATVSATVFQATPSITWPAPTAIMSGTALSGVQLNATASVPGSFTYTPAVGTVLQAGIGQVLSVTFTPTDAVNYAPVTATTSITVSQVVPTFGSIPVGTAAPLVPVTFTFDSATILGAPSIVTQGTLGLDFTLGTGSTCTGAQSAGSTCVVYVAFTPLAVGQRMGAVNLLGSDGTLLTTTLISGIGTGPQVLFPAVPGTVYSTGLAAPRGLSLDSAGNLYLANQYGGNVLEVSLKTGLWTTVSTACAAPAGTAIDGAGNIYFDCNSDDTMYEIVGGKGNPIQIAEGVHFDDNLAVDKSGNLYSSDENDGAIVEILAGTHIVTTLLAGNAGHRFVGMAIDANGNIFAPDFSTNNLYELIAGSSSLTLLASGSPLNNPHAIAVDSAGNLYVSNYWGSNVYRYAAGNYAAPPVMLAIAGQFGLVIDTAGTIYTITDNSILQGYPRTTSPSLVFPGTVVGVTSPAQTVTLENDGNANLTFSPSANANNPSLPSGFAVGSSSTCPQLSSSSAPAILASGAVCTDVVSFAPTQAGSVIGTMIATDDSLNVPGTSQSFALSGTATAGTPSVAVANASAPALSTAILTAVISGSGVAPTGTVTFNVASGPAIQAVCTAGTSAETCTASYPTNALSSGANAIAVSYAADSNYLAASGSATLTVIAATPPVLPATSTTLVVTSAGSPITTLAHGGVITLTATVVKGGAPITAGLVNFCDAVGTMCSDIHLLGTAQLTGSGTASTRFQPGIGAHSYYATFTGTNAIGPSSSTASTLTVTGTRPTTTAIAQTGTAGNYSLSATVVGTGIASLPITGTVLFPDNSENNTTLGTASLGTDITVFALSKTFTSAPVQDSFATAVADYNGDGIADLAVVNTDSHSVSVMLGNGDGTFALGSTVPTGNVPSAVGTGDFNGDGIPDIAVADLADGTVTVMLGDGAGGFTVTATVPTGNAPFSLTIGDFNGDGIADLAVANSNDSTIAILLGNGDGTFTVAPTVATGGGPFWIITSDFNGDGKLDLATANCDGTETILLGNGDGTFTPGASPHTGSCAGSLAAADFNGDGKVDLVVANTNNTVSILLGDGDGTFTAAPNAPAGNTPYSVAVGDFNGDGIADLAVADYSGGNVMLLLGVGDGTFTPSLTQAVDGNPNQVITGDFNGDGISDIATANGGGHELSVLLSALTHTATASVGGISAGAGTHNVSASYPGDGNYSASASATTPLTAPQITPTIAWAAQSIVYGTALSSGQLNATASVAGTFVYSPAPGTILTTGSNTLSVTFTPTDTVSYTSATATVGLTIAQGTPSITWPTSAAIPYGTALSAAQLDATSDVAGRFQYTPAAGTVLGIGPHSLSVQFVPSDPGYASGAQTAHIVVAGSPGFPSTPVGSTTAPVNVLVALSADATISSISVPISQGNKQEYSVGTNSGCVVDGSTLNTAGTVCTIPVTFSPAYPGVRSVPLQVQTSAGLLSVRLSGLGTGPQVSFGPGIISTIAGNGNDCGGAVSGCGDSGLPTDAELSLPVGIAVDHAGNIYFPDTADNRVLMVTAATGLISTLAGNGTPCAHPTDSCGDNGLATDANFNEPFGIAVDGAGNVYISDRLDERVRMVAAGTGIITTVAGTGSACSTPGCGDGGAGTNATLTEPDQLAVDAAGNLYIADIFDYRVRKVAAVTGIITTVAGNGLSCTTAGCGDGGPAVQANLLPTGVAVDSSGNLYISDYYNLFVRKVAFSTGIISTIAGNGHSCPAATLPCGDGGPAVSASITYAEQLAIDSAGNLYITDTGDHRIRRISASTGTITTVVGSGAVCNPTDACGDGGVATSANLRWPKGVALDSVGNLYVADTGNYRIRKVDVSSVSMNFAATPVNTTSADSPQSTTVSNIGNSDLTFVVPGSGSNPSMPNGYGLAAGTTCPQLGSTSAPGILTSGADCILSVNFTPIVAGSASGTLVLSDNALNNSASAQQIVVNGTGTQDTSTITWVQPTAITYGTALSSMQLNATASVAGTFAYSPAIGTILATGSQTLTVVFTPTDNTYSTATQTRNLTISQALPILTWATPASISYGGVLSTTELNATANTPGIFTYSPPAGAAVALGTQALSVTFTPTDTTNYQQATATVSLNVTQATSTTTLGASSTSPLFGVNVVFTASVTSGAAPISSGQINFLNSGTSIGTGTIVNGLATLSTSSLPIGANSITASYGGNTNFAASVSSAITETVSPATTSTTLSVSSTSTTFGASVMLNASVISGANPLSSGQVIFLNNGTAIGTGEIVDGIANLSTSSLPIGANIITATYGGTLNFATSVSSSISVAISPATTSTTLSVSSTSMTFGADLVFTASVTSGASPMSSGQVNFLNNGTLIGTGTIINGIATLSTSSLLVGANIITATYGGTPNFAASFSSAISVTVSPEATSTTLNASPINPIYGATAVLTASVTGGATPLGSGQVTFLNNGASIGTGTIISGVAALSTSLLPVGVNVVTATYGGTSNFTASVSSAVTLTVSPSPTFTTLSSSSTSSAYGAGVVFTASVTSGGNPLNSGQVTLLSNGTSIGTATIVNGVAIVNVATLPVGADLITASYTGVPNFGASISNTLSLVVSADATVTALTASPTALSYGSNVVLTATVVSGGGPVNAGVVTFLNDGATIGIGNIVNGVGTLNVATLPVGTNLLTASYGATSNFAVSQSSVVSVIVGTDTTTTVLSVSSSIVLYGANVTLTASVNTNGNPVSSGVANFLSNGISIGTGTILNGMATLSTPALAVGANMITATYGGSSTFAPSLSNAVSVTVSSDATSTTLTASSTTPAYGISVLLTASVTSGANAINGGVVTFINNGTSIGTGSAVNGVATLNTATLPAGQNLITASYGGISNFGASVSSGLLVTVAPPVQAAAPSATITISVPPPIRSGGTATAKASVWAGDGYWGTMKLTCVLTTAPKGAQNLPTCGLAPATLTITANGVGSTTLNFQTNLGIPISTARTHGFGLWGLGGGSMLAGLLLFCVPSRRRRLLIMTSSLLIALTMGTVGCGAGLTIVTTPPLDTSATTPGIYEFTVTGTDTVDPSVTTSAVVSVNVE